jgi:glycosyltransferase involved in cell wall biosynthesis
MGLESAGTVSATFGDLQAVSGAGYLRALSEILKRFPNHFHLFAGVGNVKAIRAHLHGEGVLPRVRFLGPVSEVAALLEVIDVYLAPFPHAATDSVLEAMAASRPVVVHRFPSDSEYNSAAELVGAAELTAPGEGDYIEITDRLLRNRPSREKQGRAMRDRFQAEFLPGRMGERYATFLDRFQNAISSIAQ